MAKDHRIESEGSRIDFTCENWWFRTDTDRGFPHVPSATRGSVLENALVYTIGGYTLWLEHVRNRAEPDASDLYWLMWYDPDGVPTIPLSSIFNREQLVEMVGQLMRFVPA